MRANNLVIIRWHLALLQLISAFHSWTSFRSNSWLIDRLFHDWVHLSCISWLLHLLKSPNWLRLAHRFFFKNIFTISCRICQISSFVLEPRFWLRKIIVFTFAAHSFRITKIVSISIWNHFRNAFFYISLSFLGRCLFLWRWCNFLICFYLCLLVG